LSKLTKLDQQERFIELRAKSVPYEEIGKELGVSKPTLIKWGKELQLDISNRKAFEWEYLQEKYFVSKKKRLEMLGEQLLIVKEELAKRDLSEIPTEKLFDVQMKLYDKLKVEEVDIVFKKESTMDDTLNDLLHSSYIEWKG